MIYCDTSLLIAALVPDEVESARAQAWLEAQETGSLAVSWWTETEVASAIALKQRKGDIKARHRSRVRGAWSALNESLTWLSVEEPHFAAAARFVLEPGARLRSSDALHLAIAIGNGCKLATFDKDLADAAAMLGALAPITHGAA